MTALGVFVVAGVCVWLLLLVLVALRSASFLFTLIWLAALHVIDSRRVAAASPSESDPA